MNKEVFLIFFVSLLSQFVFAETCPDVKTLKQHVPSGWKLYDDENGAQLSQNQEAKFISNATRFALAEWVDAKNKKSSMIHCYYNNAAGSHLEAYLAKENFSPHNKNNYWYQVSGSMQCAAGMDKCVFQKPFAQATQLARR